MVLDVVCDYCAIFMMVDDNCSDSPIDGRAFDSWDWKQSNVPALCALEQSLQCLICRDFLKVPVNISKTTCVCGHSFCSACLREALLYEAKTPCCRKPCRTCDIKTNPSLQLTVSKYITARSQLLNAVGASENKVDDSGESHAYFHVNDCGIPNPSRMQTVVYKLCKDKDLQNMIKHLRLPLRDKKNKAFTRDELVHMHKLYTCQYNALVDSGKGISREELVSVRTHVMKTIELRRGSKLQKLSTVFNEGKFSSREAEERIRKRFRELVNDIGSRTSIGPKISGTRSPSAPKFTFSVHPSKPEEELSASAPETVDHEASDSHIDFESYCTSEKWRKIYDPKSEMIIYYNEDTKEAIVKSSKLSLVENEACRGSGSNISPVSSTPAQWSCEHCTFLNDDNNQRCSMCNKYRNTKPVICSGSVSKTRSRLSDSLKQEPNSFEKKKRHEIGKSFFGSKNKKRKT